MIGEFWNRSSTFFRIARSIRAAQRSQMIHRRNCSQPRGRRSFDFPSGTTLTCPQSSQAKLIIPASLLL